MYPISETDLSVGTEIKELPTLRNFRTAARISEFVVQLEKLMGRMNPTFYGPTEPGLWLVGKIPPRTWKNCRETSEKKALTHSYDDLIDVLMECNRPAWATRTGLQEPCRDRAFARRRRKCQSGIRREKEREKLCVTLFCCCLFIINSVLGILLVVVDMLRGGVPKSLNCPRS